MIGGIFDCRSDLSKPLSIGPVGRVRLLDGQCREILIFEVAGRRFGIPGSEVQELMRAVAIEPLPGGPAAVEGVVNLRGRIVIVHDLRSLLGLPAKELDLSDQMIVFGPSEHLSAFRIDRALDLRYVEVVDTAESARGPEGEVLVALLGDGLAPVVDLRSLLAGSPEGRVIRPVDRDTHDLDPSRL
jgi:purine-binding chemotaxis protein CheW